MKNYLTIDVEDYFHVAAFADIVSTDDWDSMEPRLAHNLGAILGILGKHKVYATFFVLGWIAEKYPWLVKQIADSGHDIGCHSYWHRRIYELTPEEFQKDTLRAKQAVEKAANRKITAY